MTNKEIRKMIIIASIPAVLQMFLKSGVGITSKVMVGQMGEAAMAGVGLSEQLIFFLLMMFSAIGTGVTTLTSQSIGAGKQENIRKIFGSTIILSIIVSLLMAFAFYRYSGEIIRLMGASKEIVADGKLYLSIASFTIPSIVLTFILSAFIRAYGNNKIPMIASTVAMLFDVWLIYTFIIIFHMGVLGAALAALVARNVELVVMIFFFIRKKADFGILLKDIFCFSLKTVKEIFTLGWPVSVDALVWQFGGMANSLIILSLGTTACGVNETLKVIPMLVLTPIVGISMTITALIGIDLGKGEFEEASRKAKQALIVGLSVLTFFVLIVFVAVPFIPRMFNLSKEGIVLAGSGLVLIALFQYSNLLNMLCVGIIRAGGDTKIVILITSLGIWAIGIPLAYLFGVVLKMGLIGAIVGANLGEIVKSYLFYKRYKKGIWKKKLV